MKLMIVDLAVLRDECTFKKKRCSILKSRYVQRSSSSFLFQRRVETLTSPTHP